MDKSKLELNRRDIESGILELISLDMKLAEKISNNSAYSLNECEERVKLIRQRDNLDTFLRILGIQSHEYNETTMEVNIT